MKLSQFFRNLAICAILLTIIFAPTLIGGWYEAVRAEDLFSVKPDQAALLFESAAQRLPWRVDLLEKAGQAALNAGNAPAAIRLFVEAENHGSLSREGRYSLGEAYFANGDLPNAIRVWEQLRDEGLNSAQLYARLGRAYTARHDFDAAINAYGRARELDPQDASSRYWLGLLLATRRPQDALAPLVEAAQLDPKLDPVVQSLRQSLNIGLLAPDHSEQLAGAGRALLAVGALDLAEEAFNQAVFVNPKNALAWAWLGTVRDVKGQDGLPEMEKALALDPRSSEVFALLGSHWLRIGREQDALEAFDSAAASEPKNPAWQAAWADALARTGKVPDAMARYQAAIDLARNDPTYWRMLANFCVDYGYDVSGLGIPAALQATALAPKDAQNWVALGRTYDSSGFRTLARDKWMGALNLDPNNVAAHLYLGVFYLQQGDYDQSYRHLWQASDLDPQGPYGNQARRMIESYFQ
jgi:tetratricopeptide (TPR) repeat protein